MSLPVVNRETFLFLYMDFTLFDHSAAREHLMPFTAIRPISHIRIGIFCVYEKWQYALQGKASFKTAPHLQDFFPLVDQEWMINGSVLPDAQVVDQILSLEQGEQLLLADGTCLASRGASISKDRLLSGEVRQIRKLWDLFSFQEEELVRDFNIVQQTRTPARQLDAATVMYGKENIFIEEGAFIKAAVINAETGPVFIAKGAEVQEGSLIRGGFALCEGAVAAMGAKFRGHCTVGPYSKVGGEVNNSIFMAYSNKGHDGYIGNSVVGEWCNLAAATNVSNMKNNHSEVGVYNMATQHYEATGKKFCGVFIGDYTRVGIGTTLNTGTTIGVGVNLFDTGFPSKHIPSFSWGTPEVREAFQKEAWFNMAKEARALKHQSFEAPDRALLEAVWKKYNLWNL
jgi:UDP-N-acetylglucosamine diphosphorylase/glucosamine-1-phosphate N-acetyltransferase